MDDDEFDPHLHYSQHDEEFEYGYDDHAAGVPFNENESKSWKFGWTFRDDKEKAKELNKCQ